jgi:hypothetical protein
MNRLTLLLLGAAVGGVGAYFYVHSQAAGSPAAQNLTNAATNYLGQINNPCDSTDPNVQGYVSTWNQLNALGATGSLKPIATLCAEYSAGQNAAAQAGNRAAGT